MADSLLDLAGVPGGTPPPDNPAVLGEIERQRQAWQRDVNSTPYGLLQYGGFSPTGGAAVVENNPGTSGYFDVDNLGRIVPKIFSAPDVAQQSGVTPSELAGSIFPRPEGYNVPNDRGGFFTLQNLYDQQSGRRGAPSNVPSIGSFNATGLSTNNWRLLGRGPGWIMRNGAMIYTKDPAIAWGMPAGGSPMGSLSAEHGMGGLGGTKLGTGAPYGAPNLLAPGHGNPAAFGWPGGDQWYPTSGWGYWNNG